MFYLYIILFFNYLFRNETKTGEKESFIVNVNALILMHKGKRISD